MSAIFQRPWQRSSPCQCLWSMSQRTGSHQTFERKHPWLSAETKRCQRKKPTCRRSKGSGKWNKGVCLSFVFIHLTISIPKPIVPIVPYRASFTALFFINKDSSPSMSIRNPRILTTFRHFSQNWTVHDSFFATSQSMFLCQDALSTRPIMKMWPSWI